MKGIIVTQQEAIALHNETQTRISRPITVPWHKGKRVPPYSPYYEDYDGKLLYMDKYGDFHPMEEKAPHQPADEIYVKEKVRTVTYPYINDSGFCYGEFLVEYMADEEMKKCLDEDWFRHNWHIRPSTPISSACMPKSVARTFLRIKSGKAMQVQSISEKDAEDEVVDGQAHPLPPGFAMNWGMGQGRIHDTYKPIFTERWDARYAKKGLGWDTNPWIFSYGIERIRGETQSP